MDTSARIVFAAMLFAACSSSAPAPPPIVAEAAPARVHAIPCAADDSSDCDACDAGNAAACERLARTLGTENPRNIAIAERACELDASSTCERLGQVLETSTTPDAHGVELLDARCAAPNAVACLWLGTVVAGHDPPRALHAFETGCALDPRNGCNPLGLFVLGDFRPDASDDDLARAQQLLGASCEAGDIDSCFLRGGLGNAITWYDKACAQNAKACSTAASVFFDTTRGNDPKRAIAYESAACDSGDGYACKHLADLFRDGELVKKDARRAKELKAKACGLEPVWCNTR